MAAPFFGTTLTDLGRNITDRGMVDVAQQQAQQAYLAQLAATRAQERNVGTQVQGNRDIAQMQNESRVAHEQAIQQLNTERNELLKQESQAKTELERERIQSQLMMNERNLEQANRVALFNAIYGSAGRQAMPPGVAQAMTTAGIEAANQNADVERRRSILQEQADREYGKGRTGGFLWTGMGSDTARERAEKLLSKNEDFNSYFTLQEVTDPQTKATRLMVVPRPGVLRQVPQLDGGGGGPPSMEQMQAMAQFLGTQLPGGQGQGVGETPGGPPPQVPGVGGFGNPMFNDPYANDQIPAWYRAAGLSYDGNQLMPFDFSRAGFGVRAMRTGEPVPDSVTPLTGATTAAATMVPGRPPIPLGGFTPWIDVRTGTRFAPGDIWSQGKW